MEHRVNGSWQETADSGQLAFFHLSVVQSPLQKKTRLLPCALSPVPLWILTPNSSLVIVKFLHPPFLNDLYFRFRKIVCYYLLQDVATFIPESRDIFFHTLKLWSWWTTGSNKGFKSHA